MKDLISFLSDGTDKSSNRLLGFLCVASLLLVFIIHSLCNLDKAPDGFLAGTIAGMATSFLALKAWEKKIDSKKDAPTQQTTQTQQDQSS